MTHIMITITEAKRLCKENKNYFIAWTYGGYENERCWATKKAAEHHRNTIQIPEYAKTKAEAERYWPAFRSLNIKGEYGYEIIDSIQ